MQTEALDKLVEQAKADPQFFHALVFNPEQVLSRVDYLDREAKGAIIGLTPERLVTILVGGELADCGLTNTCTYTCDVTNLSQNPLDRIRLPERFGSMRFNR